jgi:hypothetical protein
MFGRNSAVNDATRSLSSDRPQTMPGWYYENCVCPNFMNLEIPSYPQLSPIWSLLLSVKLPFADILAYSLSFPAFWQLALRAGDASGTLLSSPSDKVLLDWEHIGSEWGVHCGFPKRGTPRSAKLGHSWRETHSLDIQLWEQTAYLLYKIVY